VDINIIAKIYNSIGLSFDIIGGFFVASEVVKKYKGVKFKSLAETFVDEPPDFSDTHKQWQKETYNRMKVGLTFLTVGFSLQIIAVWFTIIILYVSKT
jgi:hypothetical protein